MKSYFFRDRVQEKIVGWLIFSSCFFLLSSLWDWKQTSQHPTGLITSRALVVCAFWNSASHLAVVLQALNSGLVLNILIGVGFDILSSALYLSVARQCAHPLLWLLGLWHMRIHIQAISCFLAPAPDLAVIREVVQSATNNLQGNPGLYWMDHLFAYTDTCIHVFYLVVGVHMVGGWMPAAISIGGSIVLGILAYHVVIWITAYTSPSKQPSKQQRPTLQAQLYYNSHQTVICTCRSCEKNCPTCFSLYPQLCDLWFCTFEELLQKISRSNGTTEIQTR